MNDEKQKYANGTSIDAAKMSNEEKLKAIEYWCEGNQQLKKLLLYFNDKNIDTIGCCSGHEKSDLHLTGENAYIAIVLNSKYREQMVQLLAKSEEKGVNSNIAFEMDKEDKNFLILCSTTIGFNEDFFRQLNECCNEFDKNILANESNRRKYKMLELFATDKRIQEKTKVEHTEYTYKTGDNKIKTFGFLNYGYKVIEIPVKEFERMGEWLEENPELEIPKDFYRNKIPRIIYPLKQLKEKAQNSKVTLRSINGIYETIKNTIKGKAKDYKGQEESAR